MTRYYLQWTETFDAYETYTSIYNNNNNNYNNNNNNKNISERYKVFFESRLH